MRKHSGGYVRGKMSRIEMMREDQILIVYGGPLSHVYRLHLATESDESQSAISQLSKISSEFDDGIYFYCRFCQNSNLQSPNRIVRTDEPKQFASF